MTRKARKRKAPAFASPPSLARRIAELLFTIGTPVSPFYSENQVYSPHRKSATLGQEDLHYDNRDREFENRASGREC